MRVTVNEPFSQNSFPNETQLLNSIAFIKSAKGGAASQPAKLSLQSFINEQELFGALIHLQIKQYSPEVLRQLEHKFCEQLPKLRKADPVNYALRAARRTIKFLRTKRLTPQVELKEIRRYALGMAQLDDDRTRLSVSRLSKESKETPLRAIKTVLAKLPGNTPASDEELLLFRSNIRSEIRPASRGAA
jgi:hypothetical protein